jgi:signal transduction histidine kinase
MSTRLLQTRNWPMATKLTIAMVALAAMPLLIVTLYYGTVARAELLNATRSQNLQQARSTARILDVHMADELANVRALALLPSTIYFLQNTTNEKARAEAQNVLRQLNETWGYDSLYLMDQRGDVLTASDVRMVGRNLITARWFLDAIAGKTALDQPRYDPQDGRVLRRASAPVKDEHGLILGAAVLRSNLVELDQLIGADVSSAGHGSFVLLWDEYGVRLGQSDRPDLRFVPLAPLPQDVAAPLIFERRYGPETQALLRRAGTLPHVVTQSKQLFYDAEANHDFDFVLDDHGAVVCAVMPLAQQRWLYAVCTPEADIFAALNSQTARTSLVALLAGLAAASVAVGMARLSTRSLRRVAETASAIRAGDLNRRTGLNQRDEIGQLARTFDEMAGVLAAKDEELRAYAGQLEQRVAERTVELQRSNAELENYAYLAAHDLQEPLRQVASFVGIIADRYKGRLDAEADEFIGFAVAGASHMRQLLNDLLEYSRIGALPFRPMRVNCDEMLADLLSVIQAEIAEQGAVVTHEALPTLMAERGTLVLVFLHLINNAIKFRRAEPPQVHITAGRTGDGWTFAVQDNGIGIESQYIGRLFVIFRRLHSRAHYPGTGIGLALCKRIIERHGGRIWVESEPGVGSTFFFTLPDRAQSFPSS